MKFLLSSLGLIFTPLDETPDRFFPVWHVQVQRDVFITIRAEVVHRLASTEEEFFSQV
jgi:hypothetical protein